MVALEPITTGMHHNKSQIRLHSVHMCFWSSSLLFLTSESRVIILFPWNFWRLTMAISLIAMYVFNCDLPISITWKGSRYHKRKKKKRDHYTRYYRFIVLSPKPNKRVFWSHYAPLVFPKSNNDQFYTKHPLKSWKLFIKIKKHFPNEFLRWKLVRMNTTFK